MALAYALRYDFPSRDTARIPAPALLPFLIGALAFWSILSFKLHLDGFHGGWRFPAILSQLFPAVLSLMALLLAGAYLARLYTSRLILGYFEILFFLGLVAIRILARFFLTSRYRAGAVRRAVIVGSGPVAREIARKIGSHPEMLVQISGFLYPAENAPEGSTYETGDGSVEVRSLGITELLQSRGINELILALPKSSHPEVSDIVARCLDLGIDVSLVPQPYELYLSRPKLFDLDGLPLLRMEGVAATLADPIWKRAMDLTASVCLLPVAGPTILVAAAWLKMRKGQGFCSETRCGQFGRTFRMYRLNSDRNATGLPIDERLMQRFSLTELPQILNVMRGEMSLVGPRPEGLEKARHYSHWHRQRLRVKPGITGLAQVYGLREHNSSEDKTRFDLQYILHRSMFLDVSLLLQTVWTILLRFFQIEQSKASLQNLPLEIRVEKEFEENFTSAHSSQSSAD
jgi:lipopolysaccharide/colanic/teichoic acid biosynthesis glycosyltransferase